MIAILASQIGPGLSHGHGQVQGQSGQGGQEGNCGSKWAQAFCRIERG